MTAGTFTVVIDPHEIVGTGVSPDASGRLSVRFQGGAKSAVVAGDLVVLDEFSRTGNLAPAVSAGYELELATDVASGGDPATSAVGYELTWSNGDATARALFTGQPDGATVNLSDLVETETIPVVAASGYALEAKNYRDQAAASAAQASEIALGDADATLAGALNNDASDVYAAVVDGFMPGHVVTHPRFGAVPGVGIDNTAAIQAAIDLGGTVVIPPGHFEAAGLDLPDFTDWEDPWSINRPFTLVGAGPDATTLVLNDDTAPYLIGHPSAGSESPRGQNSYQNVRGMTLIGPKDATKNIPVLALSNVYKGQFTDLHIEGCPGGPAIWNYSHGQGGSQANVFARISTYKGEWTTSAGGNQLFDLDVLLARGVRYLLHNDGPRQTNGKANDTIVADCHLYAYLIGGIDTRGHGSLTETGSATGGGCDNLRIINSFFQSEATRRTEDGLLEAAGSTTFTLRTTADEFLNDSTDVYKDCILRLKNPTTGKWESRWIDSYAAGTRVVTVASAFTSFTPAIGNEYRISYSDATARADGWSADVGSHGVLWEPWDYVGRIVNSRFEKTRAVVATVEAGYDFVMDFAAETANDGLYGIRTDGTPWRPRVWTSNRPRGSTTAPAEMAAPSFVLSNPGDEDGARAVLMHCKNDTGGTVVNGAVVSIKSSNQELVGPSNNSNDQQHAVVWNPGVSSWANGERLTIAIAGIVPIRVQTNSVAVAIGDLIVPASGNVAQAISPASITTQQLGRAVGKALHAASLGGGVVDVLCKLR